MKKDYGALGVIGKNPHCILQDGQKKKEVIKMEDVGKTIRKETHKLGLLKHHEHHTHEGHSNNILFEGAKKGHVLRR